MFPWEPKRDCIHNDAFLADLEALGLDVQRADALISNDIENVLCGMSMDALDEIYPQLSDDVRLLIIVPSMGLPRLRVAFRVATANQGEQIELLRCDRG